MLSFDFAIFASSLKFSSSVGVEYNSDILAQSAFRSSLVEVCSLIANESEIIFDQVNEEKQIEFKIQFATTNSSRAQRYYLRTKDDLSLAISNQNYAIFGSSNLTNATVNISASLILLENAVLSYENYSSSSTIVPTVAPTLILNDAGGEDNTLENIPMQLILILASLFILLLVAVCACYFLFGRKRKNKFKVYPHERITIRPIIRLPTKEDIKAIPHRFKAMFQGEVNDLIMHAPKRIQKSIDEIYEAITERERKSYTEGFPDRVASEARIIERGSFF